MKWRDILIGAAISILVTVVGGVGVYYATKEPDDAKTERIEYFLSQPAEFTGGNQDLTFSTLTISNRGGAVAKNVSVLISLKNAEIRDYAANSSAAIKVLEKTQTARGLKLKYDTLLPKDTISVNLLLSAQEKPSVEVRSDARLGEQRLVLAEENEIDGESRAKLLKKMMPPAVGAILLWIGLLYMARRLSALHGKSRNNTGFLLLHSGLTDEADSVFTAAIRAGDSDIYTLSNYALCKAVKGHLDDALKLIHAAKFREQPGHPKAVVLFNEGLIHLLRNDKASALGALQSAVQISRKSIKGYCRRSIVAEPLRADPAFADFFSTD